MAKPLNIVVALTDDHGQWAAGCYGNREIHTPTLDHLAATGVQMENAFTPSPVCSPARASFFTGLFPSQHGVHDWIHPDFEEPAWLGEDTPTLAGLLHAGGYQTALCGKWHIGQNTRPQPDFDYWRAVDRNYPPRDGNYVMTSGEVIAREGYHTQLITDDAVNFLRERDASRPFFLFVGYFGTHSPWAGHPERLVAPYRACTFDDVPDGPTYTGGRLTGESLASSRYNRREALAQYYASVTHIDEGMGRIMDELEAQGLRDDTLVVYTSDHGLNCGQHGIWGKGNGTRPLNMLEESVRVPLIINCPGKRKLQADDDGRVGMEPAAHDGYVLGGQRRTEFVDHTDLFATLLDYAGVDVPPDTPHTYPGHSFRGMVQDGRGSPQWKNVQTAECGPVRMARTSRHKLVLREPLGSNELYDLVDDPGETQNRYSDDPTTANALEDAVTQFFDVCSTPERAGTRGTALRQHNYVEAWRGEKE
ncbi:MAG: sulfatase-like hydrolase/transferase [Chloroflexota bacterium]